MEMEAESWRLTELTWEKRQRNRRLIFKDGMCIRKRDFRGEGGKGSWPVGIIARGLTWKQKTRVPVSVLSLTNGHMN